MAIPGHRSVIFVSSVQKELQAERRALKEYVEHDPLLSRFFEVFLFEDIPASNQRADQVYLAEVDRCSVFVGLFGQEYGFEDATGLSPTEHEFDHATTAGKDRRIFVIGPDETRHPKMQALIRRASDQVVRRRVAAIPELTAGLYACLVERLTRQGDIRARPFDAAACPGTTLADLSQEKLIAFLARAQRTRGYALSPETPMDDALMHLNLLDGDIPSHAAVLLFGREPQRRLTTSEVKCLHFHGTEVRKPVPSYQVYKGTVFELVDQAADFVMSKIDRAVGTRAASNDAPVTYELPRDAVSEAIVNAIAHRDYASHASVQVMLFADRLEIWNPGHLPDGLTVEALRRPHASVPKNPLLAEPLFLAGYIERAGTGTLDMIGLCREAGLRPPEFRQDAGQFVQTIWRPAPEAKAGAPGQVTAQAAAQGTQQAAMHVKALDDKTLEEVRRQFPIATAQVTAQAAAQAAFFCQQPKTARELMDHLELRHWKTFQANYLTPLIRGEMLEMTIPDKPTSPNQRYRLTAKGHAWLKSVKPSQP